MPHQSTPALPFACAAPVAIADALPFARSLPPDSLDLIYIDPPFFTERTHLATGEKDPAATFSDRWQGGRAAYLAWLEERIRAMHPLLKPGGVFLPHLDWHAVHYAKVMCDGIFGDAAFVNELIWYYQTGGASRGRFSRKHDTILLYAMPGAPFHFDGQAIAIPRTPKAMQRARSGKGARIAATDTHKNPDDVLTVPALNPMSKERNGYPTQKPVELLEKLIRALCPPGGTVADFFCGSGTTLVAARHLGRKFVGCDISEKAVEVARGRLTLGS